MKFQLANLHLTLTHSKGQDQGRAQFNSELILMCSKFQGQRSCIFDCEYLGNGKHYYFYEIASHVWLIDLHLILTYCKGREQSHEQFRKNILKTVIDMVNITIAIKYQVMYRLSIGIFTFDLDTF